MSPPKKRGCLIIDAIIQRTARGKGACIASGNDGKGNKLHCLMFEDRANELVKAGLAKWGKGSEPENI